MKLTRHIILLAVACVGLVMASCDKKDCNGDLDGMWQLTLWTSPQGDTIATKDSMIFYSVQLKMMNFKKNMSPMLNINSSFEKYSEAIRVFDPIVYQNNGHDSIYPMSVLQSMGVPEDGVMRIESLTSGKLILSSATEGTLRFRKY